MRIFRFFLLTLCFLLSSTISFTLYAANDWYRPPVAVSWYWQLNGTVNESHDVDLYNIDLFDSSAELIQRLQASDKKVICYFSAGSYEYWRPDADQFAEKDMGKTLSGWDNERWLDIRSKTVHQVLLRRLDLAVEKGCSGVALGEVDSYRTNTGFYFRQDDQLRFNRMMAEQAHQRGLAIGLAINADQVRDLVDYFDFALNEQCFEYSQCSSYGAFIKNEKPVLNAEYRRIYVDDKEERNSMCQNALTLQFSTILLSKQLDCSLYKPCR